MPAALPTYRIQFALPAIIVALLIVGVISLRSMAISERSHQWIRHTHQVMSSLTDLLMSLERVESSARSFVVGVSDADVASYQASSRSAREHLGSVRGLTLDNPDQQRQLSALESLVAERLQEADAAIVAWRAAIAGGTSRDSRSSVVPGTTEAIHAVVRAMQAQEVRLLALRDADRDR
jgi:CHASE3 domain sensor protein